MPDQPITAPSPFQKILEYMRWTRASYALMSGFAAIILLIIVVWWPLVVEYFSQMDPAIPVWRQLDGLLIGIFLAMSALIMAGADLRKDAWVVFVGLAGGLVIESWGTQTLLWTYYTKERPPLWIIPAWPIASLSIDRLTRLLKRIFPDSETRPGLKKIYRCMYWLVFAAFLAVMIPFIAPTFNKSLTVMSALLVLFIILTPTDNRTAILTFAAGAGLGYFLELWGTTRACWMYYTGETPPFFAVLAHGMAAVAFWRAKLILQNA
jgi:hypothetical protein